MIQRHRLVFSCAVIASLFAVFPPRATPGVDTDSTGDQDRADVRYEARVTSPNGAQGSAVAISPVDTQKLVASTNGPNGGQRLHYSHDGGSTWTEAGFSPDWLHGGTPSVGWSTDGQFAYAVFIGGCGESCYIVFYRSHDDGVTWTSLETEPPGDPGREIAFGTTGEYRLHIDQSETSPHEDNLYVTYTDVNGYVMQLGRSKSFGGKWMEHSLSSAPAGLRGDVTTDRAGDVYYAWHGSGTHETWVSKSTNGGASFGEAVHVASRNVISFFPIPIETQNGGTYSILSADADTSSGPYADSIYLAWTDSTGPKSPVPTENHGRIQVAYSRDGGTTWSVTTPHETSDYLTVDRWQPSIAVGENGAVHVIFNDTRRSGDRLSMDVFYSYSTDGAQTWSVPERVTSEMSPRIDAWGEFGGYSGLDIVVQDLVATFTDNRHEEGGTGDSVDIYAASITPGGSSIGAGWIPGARGAPGSPLTLARLETGELQLTWSPVCGAGDDYAVYVGTIGFFDEKGLVQCSTGGATTATLASPAGDVFYLVVASSDGSAEGSYGRRSDDSERSPSQSACFSQIIGTCP